MATDGGFRMTIEDVFAIRGRGTVATGKIESGTVKVGDEVLVIGQSVSKRVVVTGIESFRKSLKVGKTGDNVGLLLKDVDRKELQRGDVLSGRDAQLSWQP